LRCGTDLLHRWFFEADIVGYLKRRQF